PRRAGGRAVTDLASELKAARTRPAAPGSAPPRAAAPRGVRSLPPGLPEIMLLVGDKLAQVEAECRRHLRSEVGVIDELGRYIAEGGGKRVRPILLLLSAQLCGYKGDRDVMFASVFEFIHTATLVHDDVIDEAELRRGRGSLNARWGNGLTVLLGDYLYIKSRNMALAEHGMNLGMAFQIIDDLLDFTASESVLGKPVASDLKEGKLTLPLIYLLQESEPAARVMVQTVLEERDFRTVPRQEIIGLLPRARTLERTRELAVSYARRAQAALQVFPFSPVRHALLALPDFGPFRE